MWALCQKKPQNKRCPRLQIKIPRLNTGPQKINHKCLLLKQDTTNNGTSKGVSAQCLFDLLQSLEGDTPDILDILELVKAEKPLKSLGNRKAPFSQQFWFVFY